MMQASRVSTARLLIDAGKRLELAGSKIEIVSESRFRLFSGGILVQSPSPIRIDADVVTVESPRGTFRVDKQLATRVGNYAGGKLNVKVGADSLSVAPYREAVVAGGLLPKADEPLRFSADDPWDSRILSHAIDLDSRLSNFARGLEAQLVGSNALDFFGRVAQPGFPTDSLKSLLGNRRSDLLIGLLLSSEAKGLQALPIEQGFSRVLTLWTDGATWGLIAQQFGVDAEDLFARLADAVAKANLQVIGPGPGLLTPRRQPSVTRQGRSRSSPLAPAPPSPQSGATPPPRSTGLLPPPVTSLVPEGLKSIIDEVYGVLDPSQSLPRIT